MGRGGRVAAPGAGSQGPAGGPAPAGGGAGEVVGAHDGFEGGETVGSWWSAHTRTSFRARFHLFGRREGHRQPTRVSGFTHWWQVVVNPDPFFTAPTAQTRSQRVKESSFSGRDEKPGTRVCVAWGHPGAAEADGGIFEGAARTPLAAACSCAPPRRSIPVRKTAQTPPRTCHVLSIGRSRGWRVQTHAASVGGRAGRTANVLVLQQPF